MIDDDALTTIAATLLITNAEGWKDQVYDDPSGHPCIGYGFRLDQPHALSSTVGSIWLTYSLHDLVKGIAAKVPKWREIPVGARAVLLDMAYQMGVQGLRGFKKMIRAINDRDYETAARELLDSNYALQTPERAHRNAKLLRMIGQSSFYKKPCDPLADEEEPVHEKNASHGQEA